jgi:membrane-associated phospholipid phosphatase
LRLAGSFAGLGFLSWYLAGKIRAFDRRGHVAKLCIVALPLLLAAMVAVSRVDDYWHHWQNVFTAGVLGRPSRIIMDCRFLCRQLFCVLKMIK